MQIEIDLTTKILDLRGEPLKYPAPSRSLLLAIGSAMVLRRKAPRPDDYGGAETDAEIVDMLVKSQDESTDCTIADVLLESLTHQEKDEKGTVKPLSRDERKRRSKLVRQIEDADALQCDDTTADWLLSLIETRYGKSDSTVIVTRSMQILEDATEAAKAPKPAPEPQPEPEPVAAE